MNAIRVGSFCLALVTLAAGPPPPQTEPAEPAAQGKPLSRWAEDALSPDAHVHEQALSVLRKMVSCGVADGAVEALSRGLKDKDPRVRARAAEVLYVFGRGPKAEAEVSRLSESLTDKSASERFHAATRVRACGPAAKAALPALTKALKDPNADVRRQAAVTLGFLGPEGREAAPVLTQVLKEEPDALHFYYSDAAAALGSIGPGAKAAVPLLARLLREEKLPHVREAAAWALGRIGPGANGAVPALRQALGDSEGEVRVLAAIGLWRVERDARRSLPVLVEALQTKERTTAVQGWLGEVARTLGEMGPQAKEATPALATLRNSPEVGVNWYARQALRKIDPSSAK